MNAGLGVWRHVHSHFAREKRRFPSHLPPLNDGAAHLVIPKSRTPNPKPQPPNPKPQTLNPKPQGSTARRLRRCLGAHRRQPCRPRPHVRARALRCRWRVVVALEFVVFGCVRTEQACACDNKNGTTTRKFYARDRYLYFAITLLNGRPWWRQLLTTMQISQVCTRDN